MRIVLTIFVLLFCGCFSLRAQVMHLSQEVFTYLDTSEKNAGKGHNFAFLDPYIKGKSIIFLGEDNHMVSEYSCLKSNLVEYLYKHHGFDILLMEYPIDNGYYPFQDANITFEKLGKTGGVFPIWRVKENKRLLEVLSREITISGIDLHSGLVRCDSAMYIASAYYKYLQNTKFLSQQQKVRLISLDSTARYLVSIAPSVRKVKYNYPGIEVSYSDTVRYDQFIRDFEDLQNDYEELFRSLTVVPTITGDRILKKIIQNRSLAINGFIDESSYDLFRDSLMAENLTYLRDSVFPDRKLLVWAHDGHIAKSLFNNTLTNSSIGMFLPDSLKAKSYFISFKMSEHEKADGSFNKKDAPTHRFSLEHDLEEMGTAFFFDVKEAIAHDLIQNNYQSSYWQSVYNYAYYYPYKLSEVFDAVFYIRKTHRPEYLLEKDIELYKNLDM